MPKWFELVFGMSITTDVSYFVLGDSSDLPTERETSPIKKWYFQLFLLLKWDECDCDSCGQLLQYLVNS